MGLFYPSTRYWSQLEAEFRALVWSVMTNPTFLKVVWFVGNSSLLPHCIKKPNHHSSLLLIFPLSSLRDFSPCFFKFSEWNQDTSLKPYLLLSLCQKIICHGGEAHSYAWQSWGGKRSCAHCQTSLQQQHCHSTDSLSCCIFLLLTSSHLRPSALIWSSVWSHCKSQRMLRAGPPEPAARKISISKSTKQ